MFQCLNENFELDMYEKLSLKHIIKCEIKI